VTLEFFCSVTGHLQVIAKYLYFIGDKYVYLIYNHVVESTIKARASIDESCGKRLEVEKRFPSLVSFACD